MPIIIGPGTAATQEDGRPRSSTLNSHWKNKRLRKAIWEKSGMDSRRGIVQKAAPESAAPTTVNAPKTEKTGQTASTLSVTNRHGAQIGAEQNRRKATGRHRKEAPQRQSLTAEAQVLRSRDRQQAKSHNSNACNKNRSPRHPARRNPTLPRAESRILPSQQKASPVPFRATAFR